MNWKIDSHAEVNLVKVIYEGECSVSDSILAKTEYLSSAHWRPGMNILVDFRKTRFCATTIEDFRKTARFNESRQDEYGTGRIAYLVASQYGYGIARQLIALLQIYTKNEIMLFMDERAALEWLAFAAVGKRDEELEFPLTV